MELKELFITAIHGELEGRELYRAASERTADKKAKKVFKNLSDEEDSHLKALHELAVSMLKSSAVEIPKLVKLETFDDAQSPIFTKEFKDAIKEKHFEVSTLRIGMKLESESAVFYRNFAKEVKDQKVKDFLLYLADWESNHYLKLKEQLSFFEEFYMTQNSNYRF